MGKPKSILITGGRGLIGTRLTALLIEKGHRVAHLTRERKANDVPSFIWDIERMYLDPEALNEANVIIHLAGTSVGEKRWTTRRKRQILDSRTESTRLLAKMLARGPNSVETFVSASGVGYYGDSGDSIVTESCPAGSDFLAQVTRQWEAEVNKIERLKMRVVRLRIGVVLSEDGGALKEIARPIRYYIGAPLGSGQQVMSWIHIEDLCRIFLKAVEDDAMRGVYNAVAPNPVTNHEMMEVIGKALHRPVFLPAVPAFALKLVFGEMAEMILSGSRVSAQKIMQAGFSFRFAKLQDALKEIFD